MQQISLQFVPKKERLKKFASAITPALKLGEGLTTPHCKKPASYKMLQRALDLDRFFGTT
jgi:hypothetical protein